MQMPPDKSMTMLDLVRSLGALERNDVESAAALYERALASQLNTKGIERNLCRLQDDSTVLKARLAVIWSRHRTASDE